jgi:ATP-dependent helicase/nuclease subunit B
MPALRARWVRWHKPWKAADGLLIEEIGSDLLKAFRLTIRPWSPSVLQQFARCPYHFAMHSIFGLRPQERPQGIQKLDPATRGQIFHEVQFQLLHDGGENALERLDKVLREVTERWKNELAPAIPQIWDSEVQSLRADLRGWLQHRAESEPGWTPLAAELSFGLADPTGRDPKSREQPVALPEGALLKGSIDLVERHSTGIVRVVDHKTGRPPEPRPEMLGGGEVLQPALYALAAEQILVEAVQSGRLYYSTVAQNYMSIDVPLNEWTRRRTVQVLTTTMRSATDFCRRSPCRRRGGGQPYLPVCGPYEEERVAVKSQAELGRLKEVRGWR